MLRSTDHKWTLMKETCNMIIKDTCNMIYEEDPGTAIDNRELVHRLLDTLTPRRRRCLELRYGVGRQQYCYTLEETSRVLGGVGRNWVRGCEVTTLLLLRERSRRMGIQYSRDWTPP